MSEYSIFPKAIDGYAQLPLTVDRVTSVSAEGINRLRSAIINIENELGVLPSGEANPNVSERLDEISSDISELKDLVEVLFSKIESWNVVSISSDYNAENLDFILVESNNISIILPDPKKDVKIAIKNVSVDKSDIFIKTNANGIEIEGENAYMDGVQIYSLYEQINLISDGTNWFIY